MLQSWVPVPDGSHFPIQNLPLGIFSTEKRNKPRACVAIGDHVLDLQAASKLEPLAKTKAAKLDAFGQVTLNEFMGLGKQEWHSVRQAVTDILRRENEVLQNNEGLQAEMLIPMAEVTMHLPVSVGDYTDFYCCEEHARNAAGFRTGVRALTPSWLKLPVAYHGRSSSVVVSGTDIPRPRGQTGTKPVSGALMGMVRSWWSPSYPETVEIPCKQLDFELEVGVIIGTGNQLGKRIPVDEAEDHIFGLVLLNDWSARDLQWFEMFPLGPFNGKNFATSISPWIVPLEALKDFRKPREEQKPPVLPYLQEKNRAFHDINLFASIQPEGATPSELTRTNFQQLHWTPQQMIAHHTMGGCNLRTGDILGTGTISSPGSGGCFLELSNGGTRSVNLEDGQKRVYLEDGDRVTLSGYSQGNGYRIGFGECTGKVLPAL